MYPYKINFISQVMFNLNLLIQKTNVTSRRAAGFYYYNTDLKNYMEARLPQYKNKMRLL